jgi:hypothetical protein
MTLLHLLRIAAPKLFQQRVLQLPLRFVFTLAVFSSAIDATFFSNHHHGRSLPKAAHRRFNNSRRNGISLIMLEQSSSTSSDIPSPPAPRLLWNRETSTKSNYDPLLPIVQPAKILSISDPSDPANHALHHGILPDGCELLGVLDCPKLDDEFADTKSSEEWKQQVLSRNLSGTKGSTATLDTILKDVNVIFVSHPNARPVLAAVIELMNSPEQKKENDDSQEASVSSPQWIHSRLAGMDFCISPTLIQWNQQSASNGSSSAATGGGIVTNAKGQFSSTLAEYAMGAMTFFAKDFARLKRNQQKKHWDKYV